MILVAVIIICFGLVQILCLCAILLEQKKGKPIDAYPMVSILLAARNEEQLILRSLRAMEELDYPEERLEILIGNDRSSDKTADLIREFIQNKPRFKLLEIESNLGKGRGKANVLAHLAHRAMGEFFFITDVDVKVPKGWIRSLLGQFEPDVGIVSGTTTCAMEKSMFSKMQSIDWLHFMGYLQSFANIGVGCTSVGNNMAVRAEAYWQTGGYEAIDFSITEDYKLFKEVVQLGWNWRTVLNQESLGLATHLDSWKEMLHQRKRWLIGAGELPWNWKFLILLYGLFVPAMMIFLMIQPMEAIKIWLLKFGIQAVYVQILALKTGLKPFRFFHLIWYEFYLFINTFLTAVFFFLPIPPVWKGRRYSHRDLQ